MNDDDIMKILTHSLLATLGALARQLNLKSTVSIKMIQFVSGCFIAAFTGIMVFFLAQSMNLDDNIAYAAAGISGWIGPQALDTVTDFVRKMAGVNGKAHVEGGVTVIEIERNTGDDNNAPGNAG
ncbi:MAG: phage holin family protein [Oscillospiraceae bacterium]|jgi:hypothetical protein|nr:phage holin family protein [Oscillospiraceae bacterium]